jgi:soluble lytic murein transglycosylase-like protein
MKLSIRIAIAAFIVAAQLPALAGEVAVLRNGFTIRCERREQNGDIMRLYTAGGHIDIPASEIASFEKDDTPIAPAPAPQPAPLQPATAPIVKTASTSPVQPQQVDLDQLVRDASSRNRLDPDFVTSVIKAESGFHPRAVSPKGAQGLMQLMPGTAAQLGVADPFDPKANVDAGTLYLSRLLDQYHDDPIKALAAYNAGAHRVDKYHGIPPYHETHAYIARIVRDFNAKKRAQMKAAAPVTTASTPAVKRNKKLKAAQTSVEPPSAAN